MHSDVPSSRSQYVSADVPLPAGRWLSLSPSVRAGASLFCFCIVVNIILIALTFPLRPRRRVAFLTNEKIERKPARKKFYSMFIRRLIISFAIALFLAGAASITLVSALAPAMESLLHGPHQTLLRVFQVYQPVKMSKNVPGHCTITLMDNYIFGNSYGKPFIGM